MSPPARGSPLIAIALILCASNPASAARRKSPREGALSVEVKGRQEQIGCADPVIQEPSEPATAVRFMQDACGSQCEFHVRVCVNDSTVDRVDVLGDDGMLHPPVLPVDGSACTELQPILLDLKGGKPGAKNKPKRAVQRHLKFNAYAPGKRKGRKANQKLIDKDAMTLVCNRPRSPQPCCGDGNTDTDTDRSESCDDGNRTNGDGCDNNCTASTCPNCVPTPGEMCDDGNKANGDRCDDNCTEPRCGNGVTALDENGVEEKCDPPGSNSCPEPELVCDSACQCVPDTECRCVDSAGTPLARDNLLTLTIQHGDVSCPTMVAESDQLPRGCCGIGTDESGMRVLPLACGEVHVGGGPADPQSRLALPNGVPIVTRAMCQGTTLSLSAAGGTTKGCTESDCLFGTSIPVNQGGSPCVLASFSSGVKGSIDCKSWNVELTLPLQAEVFNVRCPTCLPNATLATQCTPDGAQLAGTVNLQRFQLKTGQAKRSHPQGQFATYCREHLADGGCFAGNPSDGCPLPHDRVPDACSDDDPCAPPFPDCTQRSPGAFGNAHVGTLQLDGEPPPKVVLGQAARARLVGIFDIPPSYDGLVDGGASLPGPGAIGVDVQLRLDPAPAAPAP